MTAQYSYSTADIENLLPHRPPFLFVDRIVAFEEMCRLVAEKELSGDEWFFEGHFPGMPVMPGVLISEALAQASGILLGLIWREDPSQAGDTRLFLGGVNMKYTHLSTPGDTLRLTAEIKKQLGSMYRFDVKAEVGDTVVAKGHLTLAAGAG
jgi:3-hydroxyacyl-[acyl-carrier-protein] dehydratase